MKQNRFGKALLLAALATTLLGGSLPTQAVETPPNEAASIQPREIGITKAYCQLDISSSGYADCFGKVSMKSGYDSEFTLSLQRSTNGRTWSDVVGWVGSGSSALSKGRYVTSGYDYRCELTVEVYNASGARVATYTEYSDTVSY